MVILPTTDVGLVVGLVATSHILRHQARRRDDIKAGLSCYTTVPILLFVYDQEIRPQMICKRYPQ